MSTGTNKSDEAVTDRSRTEATPVPGQAADPADPKENGSDRDPGQPSTPAGGHESEGSRTIPPGPAEEEDRREHDDRGLTTDTGSSD
ncbi:hypothetical protein RCH07_002888 [Arthrobacter sp. CG_A4]|nr:hypothetical protein [Arthrobacter sp. CG_A4]